MTRKSANKTKKGQKGGFLPLLAMGIPMLMQALKGGKMKKTKSKRK